MTGNWYNSLLIFLIIYLLFVGFAYLFLVFVLEKLPLGKRKETFKYKINFVLKFELLDPKAKFLNHRNIVIDRIIEAEDDTHANNLLENEIRGTIRLYTSSYCRYHVISQSILKISPDSIA